MSACLAALHGHGLHVVRRSMLTMLCVCSYNVQGEPAQQLDAAIQDMVLRELALQLAHLNSSQGLVAFGLPMPTAQPASAVVADEIARYARQCKQPNEMITCCNLTLSNGLSMTMSWPLSTAVHFLSMALAALAKPFSTVAC
jgi:hypothetical protein